MMGLSPPIAIESLFGLAAGFLGALVLSAVPGLFALSQGDFDLGDAVAEIDAKRNDGKALAFGTAGKLMNFALVKKQFAIAEGFVVPRAAGHVLGDMRVDKVGAAGLEVHVSIADIGLAFAEGFHFGAVEDQAGLEPFEKMIVIGGSAVLRDDLLARPFGLLASFSTFGWLSHNPPFYMMRLIRVPGRVSSLGEALPSDRSPDRRKATELANAAA